MFICLSMDITISYLLSILFGYSFEAFSREEFNRFLHFFYSNRFVHDIYSFRQYDKDKNGSM